MLNVITMCHHTTMISLNALQVEVRVSKINLHNFWLINHDLRMIMRMTLSNWRRTIQCSRLHPNVAHRNRGKVKEHLLGNGGMKVEKWRQVGWQKDRRSDATWNIFKVNVVKNSWTLRWSALQLLSWTVQALNVWYIKNEGICSKFIINLWA